MNCGVHGGGGGSREEILEAVYVDKKYIGLNGLVMVAMVTSQGPVLLLKFL